MCVYYIYLYIHIYIYMMQGCHTPPPPPPHGIPPCLSSGLFGSCCFPCLVLFGLVPSPPVEWGLWSFWLAPARLWGAVCSTEVWYGCCRLLVVMSSLHVLSPPTPVGWGLWSFLGGPTPPAWGSVFYRDMVWLLPLVSSNVIVTCSLPYKI